RRAARAADPRGFAPDRGSGSARRRRRRTLPSRSYAAREPIARSLSSRFEKHGIGAYRRRLVAAGLRRRYAFHPAGVMRCTLVPVAVVHVGRVRVRVLDPFVRVRMAVRLNLTVLVRMPVVLVVDVQVLMLDRIVDVLMRVLLPEQEQDAAGH